MLLCDALSESGNAGLLRDGLTENGDLAYSEGFN